MEATHRLQVKRYLAGAEDAHGNATESFASPVTVLVYAIAPASSDEPFQSGRTAVITGLTVYAPSDVRISPQDRVLLDGTEWTVEGFPGNWTRGPFRSHPAGIEFRLKKVDG